MGSRNLAGLDFAVDLDFDEILTNPILDIAARVWDEDRYAAFKVCYRSMRRIDDLVDERKASGEELSPDEIRQYRQQMYAWLELVRQQKSGDPFLVEFSRTLERFAIPLWPWERLCRAMSYDLKHSGFSSLLEFLRYTEGAAVAPAAVFMHLCGVRNSDDRVTPPAYDIRRAARPLAVFSYLVHIVRDFRKDAACNLHYFARELAERHGLSQPRLHQIALSGEVPDGLRLLINQYKGFAAHYRAMARTTVDGLAPSLEPKYRLSVEIVYSLYSQIFERIDPDNGTFSTEELQPNPSEVKARLELTLAEFARAER